MLPRTHTRTHTHIHTRTCNGWYLLSSACCHPLAPPLAGGLSQFNESKLRQLRPCFKTDGTGTVTPGNASPIRQAVNQAAVLSPKPDDGFPVRPATNQLTGNSGPQTLSLAEQHQGDC